jgi:tRNA G46 methylase TrmB
MEPALDAGDRLFCSRRAPLRLNAIVVRELRPSAGDGAPYYQIKRLIGLAGDEFAGALLGPGWCWIEGDNKEASTDSRQIGPVPRTELVAVAIARLRKSQLEDLRVSTSRRQQSLPARAGEWWQDWRRGVTTRGFTTAASFGFSPIAVRPYHATPWRVIRHAFDAAQVDATDTLLDYGCGKGRVLIEATRYPFQRILGIDIVPELVAIARANVRADRRCHVYCADAALFAVPDDVTVIYLFNPFDGRVHAVHGE